MLNKLKLADKRDSSLTQHAKFRKRRTDLEGWTAGVFLKTRPNGERIWLQRIMVGGTRREIELGTFPTLSLSEARAAAQNNKRIIAEGGDIFAKLRRQHRQDIRDRLLKLSAKLYNKSLLPGQQSLPQHLRLDPLPLEVTDQNSGAAETIWNDLQLNRVRALGPHIDAALSVMTDAVSVEDDPSYIARDLLALSGACGTEMLERACKIALQKGDCTLWSIVAILDDETAVHAPSGDESSMPIAHENIRGPQHFN